VCLDSNRFGKELESSGQKAWLERELARERAGWTIVFFHHPLYSATPKRQVDDALRRARIAPLLERGKVDLVLAGHDHYYHRSHPVSVGREWTILHVTTGGGGAGLYEADPRDWTATYRRAHHYVWIDVESPATARIEARAVDPDTGAVARPAFGRGAAESGVFRRRNRINVRGRGHLRQVSREGHGFGVARKEPSGFRDFIYGFGLVRMT